jgi:hypothetical protein
VIEQLLAPNCSEMPSCACGAEMTLGATEPKADDVMLKRYGCPTCGSELRLMVWSTGQLLSDTCDNL